MSKQKILELCLSPDLGGLELFLVRCYENFKTKTKCHIVIAPNKKLDSYMEKVEKFYLKRSKLSLLGNSLKLARYIDKNDIDIIHFHWTKDMALVVLSKILSRKNPKIMQSRHMGMTRFKNDFYHKFLYKNISFIHAVTKKVKEQVLHFIEKDFCPKVETIYLGTVEKKIPEENLFNLKKQYNISDEFVIGIVGRIEEAKGQHLLIEAIAKLKNLSIKVIVIGHVMDNEYKNYLKELAKSAEIVEEIIYTGFTKDVDMHMKLCDCIVLATREETFGLVIIEAMMNKSCIIATNKGGPLEIIEDHRDGLLFDRSSDDLKKKIELLYESEELRRELSSNGYNKVNKFFQEERQLNILYKAIEKLV